MNDTQTKSGKPLNASGLKPLEAGDWKALETARTEALRKASYHKNQPKQTPFEQPQAKAAEHNAAGAISATQAEKEENWLSRSFTKFRELRPSAQAAIIGGTVVLGSFLAKDVMKDKSPETGKGAER